MNEKYVKMLDSFKHMTLDDKKNEVLKNVLELLKLLYLKNDSEGNLNFEMPDLINYEDDSEYFDLLFSIVISLKEENAKLINNMY